MPRSVCAAVALSIAALSACGRSVVGTSTPDAGTVLTDGASMDSAPGDGAPMDGAPGDALPGTDTVPVDTAVYCQGDVCCPASRPLACGGLCVDPATDGDHCGGCGTACGAGAFCAGGACACSMPQTYCAGLGCVDTTVDTAHCGSCGTACPLGAACLAGRCVTPCALGMHRCGDACVPDTAVTSCGTLCTPCIAPPQGTVACTGGHCAFTCAGGYHPCGLSCARDTDLATCGTACAPCPVPDHGHAVCTPMGCGVTCDGGYHPCGNACADNTAVASCGGLCDPCPASPHATATCAAGACGFTCATGYHPCAGVCSDGNDPLGCGLACIRCPVPDHGAGTCAAGACGFTCGSGYHACGSTCVDSASVASCGGLCAPCPVPTHATPTCITGTCGFRCDRGYAPTGSVCVELPRPLGPPDLATVTSRRPTLRWNLPVATGDAVVEFCRDRACATVLASLPAPGSTGGGGGSTVGTGTVGTDLPQGTVFWRVRPVASGPSGATSAVWQFTVAARSGVVTSAWGEGTDLNGDGYADLVGGSPFLLSPGSRAYVLLGSPTGLRGMDPMALDPPDDGAQFALAVSSAGDVDGDGYGDLLVGAPEYSSQIGRAYVYHGGPGGLVTTPVTTLTGESPAGVFGSAVAGVGDLDGDGYADVVVGASGAGVGGRVYVFQGTPTGVSSTASLVLDGPDGRGGRFGIALSAAGDVNADGYSDVLVGADGIGGYMGRAYVYLGSPTGLSRTPQVTLVPSVGGQFGYSLGGVGDVDGDGYPDVAVGALTAEMGLGRVYVYHGGATGIDGTPIATLAGPDGTGTQFGAHVTAAGDIDGDGYGDFTVGAPLYMGATGRAYLFRGGATVATTPAVALAGPGTAMAYFGAALGTGRDVNGDGFPDVVVSGERAASFNGQVYIYPGSATGLRPPVVITGPDGGGRFGYSLARRTVPPGRMCGG